MIKLKICLFTSILLFNSNYSSAQDINSPADIIKILEKSDVSYEISELSSEVEPPDYSKDINMATYYTTENGGFENIQLDKTTFKLKSETEVFFQKKDYEAARKNYLIIYEKYPKLSKISTYIGQTYELEGDAKTAAAWYKKSIDNNYIDYLAHWFLGRNYINAGKIDEGIEQIMIAHILNRNYTSILNELIEVLATQNIEYDNWVLNPQYNIEKKNDEKVLIEFDELWLSYALTKAVWTYEPGYKESKGIDEGEESSLEDKEALLGIYIMTEDKKKAKKIKAIKALHLAADEKFFDEYVIYESFLPRLPLVAYQMNEAQILNLVSYLKTVRCAPMKKKKRRKK